MALRVRLAAITSVLIFFTMHAASQAEDVGEIKARAIEEGALNLAGFSRDRCSFGTVIDSFATKYPEIAVTELMPDATSAEQLDRLRGAGEFPGSEVPDVVQLDYLSGPTAKADGLLQPFIANNLNELPLPAYDVEYGDRYMTSNMAIGTGAEPISTSLPCW